MTESIWFSGSITEAINEAKRLNTLFLVHVRDETEQSIELRSQVFENEDILSVLRGSVVIEVSHGSTSFAQFTQFYPVMVMPSTYFISPSGIPLEIIAGSCTIEEFLQKAKNTFEKFKADTKSSPPAESTSAASTSAQPTGSGGQSLEEKTKYAQERLKEIRERKQAEAQKAEIEKEKRRKEQMSQLSRAKVEAEDREAKQVMEERRKEKEEERLAREAIKRRIAEDRAERAARYSNAKAESQQSPPKVDSVTATPPAPFSGIVRIQLRFPDGSHQNIESAQESTLADVKAIVDLQYSHLINSSDFTLAVPYPRRVFTNAELSQSLEDLQLVPSTVLVVLPQKGSGRKTFGSSSQAVSQESNIFARFIAMFVSFFAFIISIFTGGRRQQSMGEPSSSDAHQASSSPGDSKSEDTNEKPQQDSNQPRQRLNAADRQKRVSKLESGNIHRLNTDTDDGENNTWNGNSTQQM